MEITGTVKFVIGVVVVCGALILFVPTQLNDKPKTHCTNIPDTAGGYVPVCTDPTFVSIYAKYISKKY